VTLLSKFTILGNLKAWMLAIIAVLGVLVKLLYDRGDRLDEKLGRANEKVNAARKFRENRKKVSKLDITDVNLDIRRMFPPSRDSSDPPS